MDKRELEGLEKIGEGKCATIYRKGNIVYKILKENSDSRSFYSKEMLQKLVGIKSSLCVFPNEILEDENGDLIGYSMDFVQGLKISDALSQLSFEQLGTAIKNLKLGIQEISEQGIIFEDLHCDNIMWNKGNQSFQIIDTDFFKKIENVPDLNEVNYKKFTNQIISLIEWKIRRYGRTENQEIQPFYNICEDFYNQYGKPISINEYLSDLMSIMERDFGKKFNNLNDIEIALQKKQDEVEEQQYLEQLANDLTIKQKVIRFLAQSTYIRKLPFLNSVLDRIISMLPIGVREIINNPNNAISFKDIQESEALLEEQHTKDMSEEVQQPYQEDKEENMENHNGPQTLLDSAVIATEKKTRTGAINIASQLIRSTLIKKAKCLIKPDEKYNTK